MYKKILCVFMLFCIPLRAAVLEIRTAGGEKVLECEATPVITKALMDYAPYADKFPMPIGLENLLIGFWSAKESDDYSFILNAIEDDGRIVINLINRPYEIITYVNCREGMNQAFLTKVGSEAVEDLKARRLPENVLAGIEADAGRINVSSVSPQSTSRDSTSKYRFEAQLFVQDRYAIGNQNIGCMERVVHMIENNSSWYVHYWSLLFGPYEFSFRYEYFRDFYKECRQNIITYMAEPISSGRTPRTFQRKSDLEIALRHIPDDVYLGEFVKHESKPCFSNTSASLYGSKGKIGSMGIICPASYTSLASYIDRLPNELDSLPEYLIANGTSLKDLIIAIMHRDVRLTFQYE